MNEQTNTNYNRIEEAIGYITSNFKTQPGLDEVAEKTSHNANAIFKFDQW